MLILKLLLGLGIGALVGGLLGMGRSCETGACPLTANPWRGAFFGGALGLLVVFASIGTTNFSTGDAAVDAGAKQTIRSVNEANFVQTVHDGVVLVDFWAPWCGPCRQQIPILETVARELGERAAVVKVNVDENPKIASQLKVEGIPTMILFADGQPVTRFVGVQNRATLLSAIEEAIGDERTASRPVTGRPL